MADAQNFANHTKYDPVFHFFLGPVTMINLVIAIVTCVRHPSWYAAWIIVLSIAAFLAVLKLRLYSLKVQDRVIRLEERLRLSQLVKEPLRARIPELTEGQLIALRFASDAEVAGLCEKALANNMKPVEIKKAVVAWRPDYFRL